MPGKRFRSTRWTRFRKSASTYLRLDFLTCLQRSFAGARRQLLESQLSEIYSEPLDLSSKKHSVHCPDFMSAVVCVEAAYARAYTESQMFGRSVLVKFVNLNDYS